MAAGSSSPEVCTRFLVNSILAVASAYSDYTEVLTIPGDINSRGRLFYMEAEKLWRSEEGRATLPNIQGVALMAHFLKCQGKSRPAWLMLKQGVQLAQDFGLFQSPKAFRPPWKEMSEDIQHVSAVTAWGVFILNLQVSMELQTIANLALPILKPFERESADRDIWWTPYPRSNQVDYAKKPALFGYIMTEIAKLTEVIVDIQGLLFDKAFYISIDGLWTMANELHHRLQLWLKSLSDVLNIDDQPLPQVIFLR
ncbi:hypothetical protein MW887_000279 [Aspergillus wentii]|nr:hypothetical protein MW887_000279 [Aspergillus wentii]